MTEYEEYCKKENTRIVNESYDDYVNHVEEKHKVVFANQIGLTAMVFIQNRESHLNEWLEKFKDEELVLVELRKLM